MPRSKRTKVYNLTNVDKKDSEHRRDLFDKVQQTVGRYPYVFIFSVENMRNTFLKHIRSKFKDSRMMFGKTKVMALALGRDEASAPQPGTHVLGAHMGGLKGLFFTPREPETVIAYFAKHSEVDFARAGTPATRGFAIPAGTVYATGGEVAVENDVPVAHGLEPELRRLGMPTRLVKGRVELENEYVVCAEGDVLNSRQTRLLKLFGVATSSLGFGLLRGYWSAATHEVTEIPHDEEDQNEAMEE